jgi:hypothetical protein
MDESEGSFLMIGKKPADLDSDVKKIAAKATAVPPPFSDEGVRNSDFSSTA